MGLFGNCKGCRKKIDLVHGRELGGAFDDELVGVY